jgi:hypothetical protein
MQAPRLAFLAAWAPTLRRLARPVIVAGCLFGAILSGRAEVDRSLEYQVKAAYLYNFIKFVEWPARATTGPISICVAGRNPFGMVLTDTVRGEAVGGRTLTARVISEPDARCSVLFVPEDVVAAPFLRAVRDTPTLTVGETDDFLGQGGMINLVVEGGKVRFDVNTEAPDRVELRISSRMLRLARNVEPAGGGE